PYSVSLSWADNANNESGFLVERSTDGGATFTQVASLGANVSGYADANLSPSTPYSYRVRATNSAGNSAYSNTASATTPADTTPPAVSGRSPAPSATGVVTSTAVTVTFSEAVQPSTLSLVLADGSGNPVAASVSYNAATFTATLTPSSPLSPNAAYTATASGARDLAGNAMAPLSWSF